MRTLAKFVCSFKTCFFPPPAPVSNFFGNLLIPTYFYKCHKQKKKKNIHNYGVISKFTFTIIIKYQDVLKCDCSAVFN